MRRVRKDSMSKNNKLINQLRIRAELNKANAINKAADEIIPILYAALALALNREFGFGHDRIERAFAESQRIWTEFSGNPEEMIALCEEETGIEIRAKE